MMGLGGYVVMGSWEISAKGVGMYENRVLLMANDRGEWELPGGRIEVGESPEEAVGREWREETGLTVVVGGILDAGFFAPTAEKTVLLLIYQLEPLATDQVVVSDEHQGHMWAPLDALPADLPTVYERAIRRGRNLPPLPARVLERLDSRLLHDQGERLVRLSSSAVPRIGVGEDRI